MKKTYILIVILLVTIVSSAQDRNQIGVDKDTSGENSDSNEKKTSSLRNRGKDKRKKLPVTDYKIIDIKNDTTYVDTTLSIQKDYAFNYLRRDDFGLLPINNVGQSYTSLVKKEERKQLLPLFGARARHFNFMEAADIKYYHVPTPLTELYFKTTFEQGQQLDAFITVNTSPRLNLSIAYKGVRSLGKYQQALTSTGNFRATANYKTPKERYQLKTHFVAQDLLNEENGGLSPEGLEQYLSIGTFIGQEEKFSKRGSIEVNFNDAENSLKGKRFYLDHQFAIVKKTDSSSTGLAIGHVMDLTDKSFQYNQKAANDLLGLAYKTTELSDKVALEDFSNDVYLSFTNKWLGAFKVEAGASNYNYGYNTLLTKVDNSNNVINITNRIKGEIYSVGGEYKNSYKGVQVGAKGKTIVSGDFTGNYFTAEAGYQSNSNYGAQLAVSTNTVAPNYNFLLYQSDYINYNWQNKFDNIDTKKAQLTIKAKKFAEIEASYTTINNYTYFTKDATNIIAPQQFEERIDLMKIKLTQGIKFFKFGLDNTVLYQKVQGGDKIYNVPEIITRNSLYYQDHWFKKALYLQTGVTFTYFSNYAADAYDPVLAEFYVQNEEEIGGFPQIDIFFNAKVRQTRIFFKVENFGEAFSQNKEFSSPGYAPRDAVLRFGVVWNFFL